MDTQEFAVLIPPHLAAALDTAAALVGRADAEDAVQEAVLRAWQAWSSLRQPEATRAWFLRITINVCRNWHSGHFGTHRRRTTSLDATTLPSIVPGNNQSEPGAGAHVARLDLLTAIAELEDELRQVVALRYFAGLEAHEIGEILGITAGGVRARLRRALVVLRDKLADLPYYDLSWERST